MEAAPGFYISDHKLKFDIYDFHEIFDECPVPIPIRTLISRRLLNTQQHIAKYNSSFLSCINSRLKSNPNIINIGNYWISKAAVSLMVSTAIRLLNRKGLPLSADEMKSSLTFHKRLTDRQLEAIRNLLNEHIPYDSRIITLLDGCWLHKNAITQSINSIYAYLLTAGSPQNSEQLIRQILKIDRVKFPDIHSLEVHFDQILLQDHRFCLDPATRLWTPNIKTLPQNLLVFNLLERTHMLYSLNDLLQNLTSYKGPDKVESDLMSDHRFKLFPDSRWGLSEWVWINDYAFDYLLTIDRPLSSPSILDQVCLYYNVSEKLAIFTPETDPRFYLAQDNLWKVQHILTQNQIEQLLSYLNLIGEKGITSSDLLRNTLGLNVSQTDANEKMSLDDRFFKLNDFWFSRSAVFYNITDTDLNNLYSYLTAMSNEQLPIMIDQLILDVLHKDYLFTDAVQRLELDPRFREIYPDWWVPDTFIYPLFDRSLDHGPKFFSDNFPISSVEDGIDIERLTERDRIRKAREEAIRSTNQIKLTLRYLDVLHNDLRIKPEMLGWLNKDMDVIEFYDKDTGEVFIAFLNKEHTILQLGDWLNDRNLTFGDKIVISATQEPGSLIIHATGERDERVYNECLRRQDSYSRWHPPEEARKSFHDLIIDVMQQFDEPLHIEEIYRLVDSIRPANRNTISQELSLTDIRYEELRYFVSHGNGYWSFDPQRREAYDMKIKDLEDKIAALNLQLSQYQTQLSDTIPVLPSDPAVIEALEEENSMLSRKVTSLENSLAVEKASYHAALQEKDIRLNSLNQQNDKLTNDLFTANSRITKQGQQQSDLAKKIEELTAAQATNRVMIADQKQELIGFTTFISSFVEQITSYEKTLADVFEKIRKFDIDSGELRSQLDLIDNTKNQTDLSLPEIHDNIVQFHQLETIKRSDYMAQLAKVKLQIDKLIQFALGCVEIIQNLKNNINDVEEKCNDLQEQKKNAQSTITNLHARFKSKEAELANLRSRAVETETLKSQLSDFDITLTALKQRVTTLESDNKNLLDHLNRQIAESSRQAADQIARIKVLNLTIQNLNQTLNTPLGKAFVLLSRSKDLADYMKKIDF